MASESAYRFNDRYWAVSEKVVAVVADRTRDVPLWHAVDGCLPLSDQAEARSRAWLMTTLSAESARDRAGLQRRDEFCENCLLEERQHVGLGESSVACCRCGLLHRGEC